MNATKPPSHAARPGRAAPRISVSETDRALHFHTDVLGVTKVFESGSPVGFVVFKKDDADLHRTLFKSHKATVQNVDRLMAQEARALRAHLVHASCRRPPVCHMLRT